ncbi:DUF1697 domain-containing protein [Paraburkholderia diazotrophica]|uniref:DUF1697 domain-containing protein n=1 Tax=Paraburkholderia diazotrophica TaxID=667676 RepID=UPI00317C3285
MITYVALLRAVNVGGTGKLPMTELRRLCEEAGFINVRTYIASGNVVFESKLARRAVQAALETRLEAYAGKPVGVLIRTGKEMADVLHANPFSDEAPNRTVAIFLDGRPPADTLDRMTGQRNEKVALGKQEIYVHYGEGMANSKLKIPAAKTGTARNINTIATLAEWAAQ